MSRLYTDTRGQPIGLGRFFLSLIVGAILIFIVATVTSPILDRARNTGQTQTAADATSWFQSAVDLLPIVFLLIAFFGILAVAVFQREVLR